MTRSAPLMILEALTILRVVTDNAIGAGGKTVLVLTVPQDHAVLDVPIFPRSPTRFDKPWGFDNYLGCHKADNPLGFGNH